MKLNELGQVYVTHAAASKYAYLRNLLPEAARRELTVLLLDATVQQERSEPLHVRARSRTTGLDVSATVTHEGRLLVVLSVNVRER